MLSAQQIIAARGYWLPFDAFQDSEKRFCFGRRLPNARMGCLCFLHVVTCLLPVAAASLFACILVLAQRSSGFGVTETTVSYALALYPNYPLMLALLVVASTLMYVTTAVRNVQVRIWFRRRYGSYLRSCCCCCRRKKEEEEEEVEKPRSGSRLSAPSATCLAVNNDLASVVNILAYVAFLLLAVFPVGSEGWRNDAHDYSAIAYFALSTLYGGMQTALTWKQGVHYPAPFKFVQLGLVLATLAAFAAYGYTYLGTDNPIYVAEWIAVFGSLIFVAFFAVMFHVDSASDELVEFFCPCCSRGGKGDEKSSADDYQNFAEVDTCEGDSHGCASF